ncbi:MAG: hypothetical protein ACP5KN_15845, partial [Armatimonadota bacterium]
MTRKATIAAALTLCLLPAGAQELTNHALGRPYRVTPAPADRYADASGLEPHIPGKFYRGELTDGVSGPQDSYKAAQWVGWRDTDYREPISVEVDLEEEVRVDRVEATVCGSPGSIQPPERIDLALLGEGFPWPVFVQVAQIEADAPWDPETTRVYTYAADIGGLPARRVRLDFQEQTWSYLFVDEIRILGLERPAGGMLPVQDVTLQAEAGHTECESVQVEGASGRAVLLHEPGERVRFEMPLPAGDYTVRVRSLAVEPDTFSEIALTLGEQAMRPQAITNTVFTWQRSHFTQPRDGPATVTMTLREGAGVYLDQVRIHRLTLNETITRLHDFRRDTILASGGEPRCLISVGDEGQYRAQGEAVAAAIEDRCGARPKILEGDQIAEEHFRTTSVIELGTAESTFAILRSSPNAWSRIPGPPEDGEPQIYVDVEPRGTGVNTIVLGGVDEAQVRRSVRAFIERLEGGETLSYPWGLLPVPAYEDDREHYRQMAVESGKWLRQGAIRHLHRDWKYYPDDTFVLLGYRYLEYLDSYDTIRQIASDGFIDAETQKIVGNWDRREHHQSFAGDRGRLHRLQLTNLILLMARKCEGIFDWNCCQVPGEAKSHHPPEEMTQILQQRREMIAHNHQTFPTYAIATAGDYFAKYYDLPEARRWVDWAEMFMRGPLQSSKPMEDCWGYMDITYTHVARYAAITGRWDWFDQPMLYDFLTLRLMSHDNMGSGVGYGDVGAYRPADGPVTPEDSAGNWLSASGGRLDLSRARWDGVTRLYVHPLEPMYYDYYGEDSPVPLEECFDKLSFRDEVEPRAPYLLLDGVSGGYHGHWDGNSILRFTANSRMWLCEGDYLKSDPKDHNTLTIMRNAESGTPGLFSSLQARFEAGPWASTITRTPDYTGLDWDRHLIYSRRGETFLLFDEVTAVEPGTYDVKARFRSLGETSLAESTWHVQQQGEHFFLHAPSPGRLMEATDPEDTSTWESYQFADDTTPKLLSHGVRGELQPGERMVLPAVFYATSQDAPRQSVRRVADGAIVIDGDLRAVAGVGGLSLEHMHSDARQFVAGEAGMLLVEGTRLSATGETLMLADAPVRLSVDTQAGTAVIEADRPARLRLSGLARPIELDAGRHELHGDFGPLAAALAEAWRLAWDRAQAEIARPETAPTRNMTPAFEMELPAEVTVLE